MPHGLLFDSSYKKNIMQTKSKSTHIVMPDDNVLEVTYYCADTKLKEKEKVKLTQLFIQLDDCTCTMKIDKAIVKEKDRLERLVHNKVVHERGHLC